MYLLRLRKPLSIISNEERKNEMKKLIALLLALAMVLSMAACGSSSNETAKTDEPAAEGQAAEAATAAQADSMTIGMTLDPESFNPWLMANDARQQVFYNKIYETLAFLRPDGSRE